MNKGDKMSGPKTSKYTLTREQRRILAEQRIIERRKAVASESIKRASATLYRLGGTEDMQKTADELAERTGSDHGYSEKTERLKQIIESIEPVISAADRTDVDSLERASAVVNKALHKAERLSAELSELTTENEKRLREVLSAEIDKGFSTSFLDIMIADEQNQDAYEDTRERLLMTRNAVGLPHSYVDEIDRAIEQMDGIADEGFRKSFIMLTAAPLLKKCDRFISEYRAAHDEFETLYSRYAALCGMYYLVIQEFECSSEGVEKLRAEIRRIEALADEDDERSYISEALDEVMEEMGYTIVGSREVRKKNGNHFRSELYSYADGTVVNVTFSSDGRIAMELGGADTSDRLPDEHETAALCERMEDFCEDFREIEKHLAQKGVVLDERIALQPPEAVFAQIINISDYHLNQEVDSLRVRRKARKQTTPKSGEAE